MIEISRFEHGITIKGHAEYAKHGDDIVCAAVSMLAQTLIASFEALTEDTIQYDLQPGWVDIRYRKLSANARLLISSFFVGATLLADNYPANVQIVQAWKTE